MKEIVIKIPDEEYNLILKSDDSVFADCASKECMMYSIKNGIELPKGHKRLIEDKVDSWLELEYDGREIKQVEDWYNIPTIIEADKEDKNADSADQKEVV